MIFYQVGLVAINVLGTRFDPAGPSDLAIDMSLDPRTAVLLRELHAAKVSIVSFLFAVIWISYLLEKC